MAMRDIKRLSKSKQLCPDFYPFEEFKHQESGYVNPNWIPDFYTISRHGRNTEVF